MPGKRALAVLIALVSLAAPAAAQARAGDIFIGDSAGKVLKMDPRTGTVDTVASGHGLTAPDGLDFATNGTIFVADYSAGGLNSGGVFRVNPRTGQVIEVAVGGLISQPLDLLVGRDGNAYAADLDTEAVLKVKPGPVVTSFSSGQLWDSGPLGVDDAASGTMYAVDGGAGTSNGFGVIRINRATGAQSLAASGPPSSDAYGLAVAPNGKTAYVADDQHDQIYRVDLRSGAATPLTTSGAPIGGPTGLALAPNGILYVANFDNNNVLGVKIATGVARQVGSVGNSDYPEGITLEPPRCGGKYATVVGTTGNDRLKGSRLRDVIATLGGRDRVRGLGGNDVICGGKGPDRLIGGGGRDRLFGGPGPDACDGGPGRDRERSC